VAFGIGFLGERFIPMSRVRFALIGGIQVVERLLRNFGLRSKSPRYEDGAKQNRQFSFHNALNLPSGTFENR
jgi:hypothetical protein